MNVNQGFRQWLISEKGLTYKSASDVISRLNRVNEFPFKENSPEMMRLPAPMKKQLERAIRLQDEYWLSRAPQIK